MKKSNGFTLVEILMVIVILAVILLIAAPSIISVLGTSKLKLYDEQLKKIEEAASQYILMPNSKPFINGTVTITLSELINENYFETEVRDPRCGRNFDKNKTTIDIYKNEDGLVEYNIKVISPCGNNN